MWFTIKFMYSYIQPLWSVHEHPIQQTWQDEWNHNSLKIFGITLLKQRSTREKNMFKTHIKNYFCPI